MSQKISTSLNEKSDFASKKSNSEKMVSIINDNISDLEKVISSKRFKIKGILGKGSWGTVYRVEDTITGKDYALKKSTPSELAREQMRHRNLEEREVMLRELPRTEGDLSPSKYLVPRWMEVGDNGELYLVMNIFQKTFADVIGDNGNRKWLGNGLSLDQVKRYATNLADSFVEYEKKYDGPHCDAKSSNMMIGSEGEILLNDMGISTCVSSSSNDPRDNMGSIYVRSPENFLKENHPNKKATAFSFGANLARLLTGKYPLEDRLNENPNYINNHTIGDLEKEIKKFIKKQIPRKWHKPFKKWLSPHTYERSSNAQELKQELTDFLKKMDVKEYFGDQLKKYGIKVGTALAVTGAMTYAILTKEATTMEIPDIQTRQTIYQDSEIDGKVIFKFENHPEHQNKLSGLNVAPSMAYRVGSMDSYTSNYFVARLMELYNYSISATGGLWGHSDLTPEQHRLYASQNIPSAGYIANNMVKLATVIEYALGDAKFKNDGKSDSTFVDAEDFAVVARLGPAKLAEAWKYSGSTKYADYIHAKYPDGKPVIIDKEKEFISEWIFNINNSGRYLRIAQE